MLSLSPVGGGRLPLAKGAFIFNFCIDIKKSGYSV